MRRADAPDELVVQLDALMRRYDGNEWRLTRSTIDNAGESLMLEVNLGGRDAGRGVEARSSDWHRVGRQHEFRHAGMRLDSDRPLSLRRIIADEHDELDQAVAAERLRRGVSP